MVNITAQLHIPLPSDFLLLFTVFGRDDKEKEKEKDKKEKEKKDKKKEKKVRKDRQSRGWRSVADPAKDLPGVGPMIKAPCTDSLRAPPPPPHPPFWSHFSTGPGRQMGRLLLEWLTSYSPPQRIGRITTDGDFSTITIL